MRQPPPRYPARAITQYPTITETLRDRYGPSYWPVIWYELETQTIVGVTYEVNARNDTNAALRGTTDAVLSTGGRLIAEAFADYVAEPREPPQLLAPKIATGWPPEDLTAPAYTDTYQYVTSNPSVSTVDLDYLWWTGEHWRGLELTTFYVRMRTEVDARHLIRRFIEERVGRPGAHQMMILARFADRMAISMRLVFVNVVSSTDDSLVEDGNVAIMPLDIATAEQLQNGDIPDFRFAQFSRWLQSL